MFDIIVVGGGPAGVCAAVAAARLGAKVMIAESGNCLGGMATLGLVSPFMTCFDGDGEQMVIRGLFEEIVDRMVAAGGAIHPKDVRHTSPYSAWITAGHDHCTPFEAEAMKYVLDTICAEAGVKVLYHAEFVEPVMKRDTIAGAVLMTRKGLQAASAKVVIDCTGDGDLLPVSGIPSDDYIDPNCRITHLCFGFWIGGVEFRAFDRFVSSKPDEYTALELPNEVLKLHLYLL